MIRNDEECAWALRCCEYNAKDPCEKPSYRFMRKPVCYIPKKDGFVSRLAGKITEGLARFGEAPMGGKLENSENSKD